MPLAYLFYMPQFNAQKNVDLYNIVQLTKNGRNVSDASKVVVWLTAFGDHPCACAAPAADVSQTFNVGAEEHSFSILPCW